MKIIDIINWILVTMALGTLGVMGFIFACLIYDIFNGKLYQWKSKDT
jgi:hypothetical protein